MRRLYDAATDQLTENPPAADIARRVADAKLDFWLDIESPTEEDYSLLADDFKFHPLTIEDVRHRNQRPKYDEYPGYGFMVLFCAHDGASLTFHEHHLYLGEHLLVTVHEDPEPALKRLTDRLKEPGGAEQGRIDFLTYLVVDSLVDQSFDVLDGIDEAADRLQDQALARPTPNTLHSITDLRHDVATLRRHLAAERDMFQRLVTTSLNAKSGDMLMYYRDVYDHLVRQYEQADGIRDLLSGAMDVYLSTVSNRLNETMRALTAIASLFLPLTFLTGFFGQNFAFLVVHIGSVQAFSVGMLVMAGSVALQLYLFRRRGWI